MSDTPIVPDSGSLTPAQQARLDARAGRLTSITRGVAMGYMQAALVILPRAQALDFAVFCQRNQRACPVFEITDPGATEARRVAPGSDLRTDLPRYSVYRDGVREDVPDVTHLWRDDLMSFVIGSGITWDLALERAGVQTKKYRWVLNTALPTDPCGPFHGPVVVTMRLLTPAEAVIAIQLTSRFPFNHGAPIHIGDPREIGADLQCPIVGPPIDEFPRGLVPVLWACSVTPQAVAASAKVEFMMTSAPAYGFITDLETDKVCIP